MTPEEFAEAMCEIFEENDGDPEGIHCIMDDLLCSTLESLGYGDGIKYFNKQDKWYA